MFLLSNIISTYSSESSSTDSLLTPSPTPTITSTPTPTPTPTPEPPAEFGSRVIAGNFAYTFHGKYTVNEIGEYMFNTFYGKSANGIYLVLDVTVENIGKDPATFSSFYTKIVDLDKERNFERDSGAETALAVYEERKTHSSYERLQPGLPKRGKIVFDIPTDLSNANIRVRDDAFIFYTEKYIKLMGVQVKAVSSPTENTVSSSTELATESEVPIMLITDDVDFKHKIQFSPSNVKINSGSTIFWRNEDDRERHFILISSEGLFPDKNIDHLKRYSYQFKKTGIYYFSIKEFPEVTLKVEVV